MLELKINYLHTSEESTIEDGRWVSTGKKNYKGKVLPVIAVKGDYNHYYALIGKEHLSETVIDYFQKQADFDKEKTWEWNQPWALFRKCENNNTKLPVLNRGQVYIVETGEIMKLNDFKGYQFSPKGA